MNRRWSGAIAVEGKWTEDGRILHPDAIFLDGPAYVVDLKRSTFSGDRILGVVERLRRNGNGVVHADGSIDWPSPSRIVSIAVELVDLDASRGDDGLLTIRRGQLVRVCVNSDTPSWADTVGITVL